MELSQTNTRKWGSVTPIWQLPVILAPQLLKFLSSIVICVSEPASWIWKKSDLPPFLEILEGTKAWRNQQSYIATYFPERERHWEKYHHTFYFNVYENAYVLHQPPPFLELDYLLS